MATVSSSEYDKLRRALPFVGITSRQAEASPACGPRTTTRVRLTCSVPPPSEVDHWGLKLLEPGNVILWTCCLEISEMEHARPERWFTSLRTQEPRCLADVSVELLPRSTIFII